MKGREVLFNIFQSVRGLGIFISSCVCSIFILIAVFFVYIPNLCQERIAVKEQLDSLSFKYNEAFLYYQKHKDYEIYESKINKQMEALNKNIPKDLLLGNFMSEVQTIALLNQVQIINLEPGEILAYENYKSQQISVKIYGNFYQILYFLRNLEETELFIHVEKVSINNFQDGIECKLGLRIFSDLSKLEE